MSGLVPVREAKESDRQIQNELLQMIRTHLIKAGKSPSKSVPKDLERGTWRYHATFTMQNGTPQLHLALPDVVDYKRAFEKWGSEHFISCKVKQSVANMGAQTQLPIATLPSDVYLHC